MNNEIELIQNINYYYQMSLKVLNEFGGPSIYFHIQAIKEQKNDFLSNRHIEMIYATLASWGMHRMGDPANTKAKMVEFDQFYNSIINSKDKLVKLIDFRMDGVLNDEYREIFLLLEPIYKTLRVSISNATIVAHSKVLAHILPNLLPPIDRQYTIRFFTQDNKKFFTNSGQYKLVSLPDGIEKQYEDYVKYCINIKEILDKCNLQEFEINPNTFNTSYPKIIDNVLMAFVKNVQKSTNAGVNN
jgi:hypothetical protein